MILNKKNKYRHAVNKRRKTAANHKHPTLEKNNFPHPKQKQLQPNNVMLWYKNRFVSFAIEKKEEEEEKKIA